MVYSYSYGLVIATLDLQEELLIHPYFAPNFELEGLIVKKPVLVWYVRQRGAAEGIVQLRTGIKLAGDGNKTNR